MCIGQHWNFFFLLPDIGIDYQSASVWRKKQKANEQNTLFRQDRAQSGIKCTVVKLPDALEQQVRIVQYKIQYRL